jgi:hypothetical protein
MATPNIVLDINDKHELVRVHGINGGRKTVLARLDPPGNYTTIYWKDAEMRDSYHKSVEAYLTNEKVNITTVLMEGQKPDVISPKAPPPPEMHPLQGDLTPAYVEWMLKWAPIKFQNVLGVKLKKLKEGEEPPKDPRDLWVRADVIRTDSRPRPGTNGGEYMSTRFKARDQIIARRSSHLTFTEKEILKEQRDSNGDLVQVTVEPYEDRYSPELIDKMEKKGDIEVVWRRHAAASAGSSF